MQNAFIADYTLIQALEKQSSLVPCGRGVILFRQGEIPTGIFIIRSGKASLLVKAENGVEVAHFTVGAGSILGLPAIVAKDPYTLSAMANEGSEIRFMKLEDFAVLMQEQPSLFPKVLEVLASEVRSARAALTGVLEKTRKPFISSLN
jgi:CRP-like cAMP-binding protein